MCIINNRLLFLIKTDVLTIIHKLLCEDNEHPFFGSFIDPFFNNKHTVKCSTLLKKIIIINILPIKITIWYCRFPSANKIFQIIIAN